MMQQAIAKTEPDIDVSKQCKVCKRLAYGSHYGVLSCYACKMFFRRMTIQKLTYECKGSNDCFKTLKNPLKCQPCRFQKCQDSGMCLEAQSPEEYMELKISNGKIDELAMMLKSLTMLDRKRHWRLTNFYSVNDESLEEILNNPRVIQSTKTDPEYLKTPEEWAFLALYSHMTYFLNFDFVHNLNMDDKIIIFQFNTLKLTYFCGLMRTLNEKRIRMLNPGGQEIYPDDLINLYRNTPQNLLRICSQPVERLIDLRVTNEEYCLLNLIFFCNPAIPDISENARIILSANQKFYSDALFQYCQLTHQQNAPSRLADLLSLYVSITNNAREMEELFLIFDCNTPHFEFKKLVRTMFHF